MGTEKNNQTVFSQYKIMLHLEKNIYTLARQKCCARIQAMPTP